ncbi:MAG: hypothetical protein WC308_01375 [archaeon]
MKKAICFATILLVTVFLLLGCTQENQTTNNTTNNNTPGTTINDGTNTNPEGDSSTQPSENATDSAYNEFKSKITGLPTYYVAYDMVTPQMTAKLKQWLKTDRMRQDTIAQGTETSVFVVDGTITICTNAAGQTMCFPSSEEQGATDTGSDVKNNVDSLAGKVTKLADKTIAGTATSCYKINDPQYDYSFCYSADGVPLYIEVTANGTTTTMTSYEYSKTVDDSVFTIPEHQTIQLPS